MRPDDVTLVALMGQAQAGDAVAYRVVLEASRTWLRRFYAGRVAPDQIDDLVQDTLASVHRKRASYDPGRPFLPWLAAIARYRWVDHLRVVYSRAEASDAALITEAAFEAEVLARISLDRMLARLAPAQAQAIRLVKIEGLSIAEASIRAGQSEALVKVNIHRGLRRLAQHIESD